MNPIDNLLFFHDAEKYVYQNSMQIINQDKLPAKPFKIDAPEKSKKTNKDVEKRKQREEKKDT